MRALLVGVLQQPVGPDRVCRLPPGRVPASLQHVRVPGVLGRVLLQRDRKHGVQPLRSRPVLPGVGVDGLPAVWEAVLAALFGALPLALESGTGSELRFPLGVTIIGGLLLSQLLTLYTTPVVYLYLDRLRLWRSERRVNLKKRLASPASEAGA